MVDGVTLLALLPWSLREAGMASWKAWDPGSARMPIGGVATAPMRRDPRCSLACCSLSFCMPQSMRMRAPSDDSDRSSASLRLSESGRRSMCTPADGEAHARAMRFAARLRKRAAHFPAATVPEHDSGAAEDATGGHNGGNDGAAGSMSDHIGDCVGHGTGNGAESDADSDEWISSRTSFDSARHDSMRHDRTAGGLRASFGRGGDGGGAASMGAQCGSWADQLPHECRDRPISLTSSLQSSMI